MGWRYGRISSPIHHFSLLLFRDFFDEFRLQAHGADAGDFAVDVVIAIYQADILHFRADLDDRGRAFDFQVLDHRNGVPVLKGCAVGVFNDFKVPIRFSGL